MRIAVIGAGAVGSLFGGLMARAGADVTLVTINREHIAAINAGGLVLELVGGEETTKLPAIGPEALASPFDLLLIATKTYDTETALAGAVSAIGAKTRLISLQNGLGNAEVLVRFAPPERVLVGMTTWPADARVPGRIAAPGEGVVVFAPLAGALDEARDIEALLANAGLNPSLDEKAERAIWEKAAFNAAMNPICALGRATPGDIGRLAQARALAEAVILECEAVAAAAGIDIRLDKIRATIAMSIAEHAGHIPSMRQDLEAGRRTEIEALNGAFAARGRELAVPTPLNGWLSALVGLAETAAALR